jgi:epoxyqueuosine reductase
MVARLHTAIGSDISATGSSSETQAAATPSNMPVESLKSKIAARAMELGFDLVGVSPVEAPAHGNAFSDWLRSGRQGEMGYLPRTEDQRLHPERYLPWAKSVVSVGVNYNTHHRRSADDGGIRGWISRYAWGDDYHDVMRTKLERLLACVQSEVRVPVQGKAFVDAGPVLDREVATRAGIGWFGKNTNLLSARVGSFFFLGELFLSVALEPDQPLRDRCGQCRLCLDACPTDAFVGPYVLDARKCISYLTIELKGVISPDLRPAMGTHIFGCDVCQDVCPYNTHCRPTAEPAFQSRPGLHEPELLPLLHLTEAEFKRTFRGSPILRAKRSGFLRNVCVALGNLGRMEAVPSLVETLKGDPQPLVRAHAAWALGQIGGGEARAALQDAVGCESDAQVLDEIRMALRAAEERPGV